MSSAASVLVCVLSLLGGGARTLPPIELLDVRPPDVSPYAEAFVRRGPDVIYLITSTPVFRAARRAPFRCGDLESLKKLASIIVHETWHVRHGRDERGAYEAQLTELTRLGSGPGTALYHSVMRSMLAVLDAQRRAPRPPMVAAARR